jgi:hypothetical protein
VVSSSQFSVLYNNQAEKSIVLSLSGTKSHINSILDEDDISFVSAEDLMALSGNLGHPTLKGIGKMRISKAKKFAAKYSDIIRNNNGRIPEELILEIFGNDEASVFASNRKFFSIDALVLEFWDASLEGLIKDQLIDYYDKDRLSKLFLEEFSVVPVSMEQLFLGEDL